MTAYLYKIPYGQPGDIADTEEAHIISATLATANKLQFGDLAYWSKTGQATDVTDANATAEVAGVVVRAAPVQATEGNPEVPNVNQQVSLLTIGYIVAHNTSTTAPVIGQQAVPNPAGSGFSVGAVVAGSPIIWAANGNDANQNSIIKITI